MGAGWELVARGIEDEDRVAKQLTARGWEVTPMGQRMWDPRTCPAYGRPAVIAAVRASHRPIRHAPDWLVARGATLLLVEVIANRHEPQRCMEIAKLRSNDDWCRIAPVVYVDAHHWTQWLHRLDWPYAAQTDVSRYTHTGSGDPYAWFGRDDEHPFDALFGRSLNAEQE